MVALCILDMANKIINNLKKQKMKLKLLSITLFIFSIASVAQNQKLSIEASYPFSSNNNIEDGSLKGVVDFGLKYRFIQLNALQLGVSLNATAVNDSESFVNELDPMLNFSAKATGLFFHSKIFAEFNIKSIDKLHPTIGIGYTHGTAELSISSLGNNITEKDTTNGIGFTIGTLYDFSSKFFGLVQYDASFLSKDFELFALRLGIGFRI